MELYKIFTPSSPAIETFVKRDYLEKQLIQAMNTPGKQIIIFGPSGSGKSTLILNKYSSVFKTMIKSVCQKDTTFNELIKDAFDQLNEYYLKEYQNEKTDKITGELSSSFWKVIAGKLEGSHEDKKSDSFNRIVEFQLNERNLSKILRESNCCWIIEDFHKVAKAEKDKLADSLKLFTDDNSQIIAIGAVNSPTEVLSMNEEMNNRIAEIRVPLMDDEELFSIIENGTAKLNVEFDSQLSKFIIRFSNRYGANCHQLCLNICENGEVYKKQKRKKVFTLNDLKGSVNAYLYNKSDSYLNRIQKAIGESNDNLKSRKKIIIAYLNTFKDVITVDYLANEIDLNKSEVKLIIDELTEIGNGEIFEKEYNSDKYFISNPFFYAYCIRYFQDDIQGFEWGTREEVERENFLTNNKAITYVMREYYLSE